MQLADDILFSNKTLLFFAILFKVISWDMLNIYVLTPWHLNTHKKTI